MANAERGGLKPRASSLLVAKAAEMEEKPKGPVKKNDIREIRTIR